MKNLAPRKENGWKSIKSLILKLTSRGNKLQNSTKEHKIIVIKYLKLILKKRLTIPSVEKIYIWTKTS